MIVDPRKQEAAPSQRPSYTEDGCARGWQIYTAPGLAILLLIGAAVGIATGNAGLAVGLLALFLVVGFLAGTGLMIRWPLGIRMDEHGVRIGGVHRDERHPGKVRRRDKPLRGFTRALHVYACPWPAVRRVAVLSERSDISLACRRRTPSANGPWWSASGAEAWAPGKFASPTAKGLLVLEVDPAEADFQRFRPPRRAAAVMADFGGYYDLAETFGTRSENKTMVWVIPTRHPERLRAALHSANPPIPVA